MNGNYPDGVTDNHPYFCGDSISELASEAPGIECPMCGFEQFGKDCDYSEGDICPECGEPLREMSHEKKVEKILSRQDDGVED